MCYNANIVAFYKNTNFTKMRFYLNSTPEYGALRKRNKFAYFPTKVGNVVVWLESYTVYEKYTQIRREFGEPTKYGWQETDRVLYGL
jgi:hypothetical protein